MQYRCQKGGRREIGPQNYYYKRYSLCHRIISEHKIILFYVVKFDAIVIDDMKEILVKADSIPSLNLKY